MIQDNTAKWRKKKLSNFASNNAMPVGHIYQSLSKNVPVGSLPLLGGTYDRTLYADLWSWANENGLVVSESEWQSMATAQGGSCSKFSDGNGSTTFRVPALKCWIRGANGVEEVGSYLEAGLPNATGFITDCAGYDVSGVNTNSYANGAFYANGHGLYTYASERYSFSSIGLDLSKSNQIFGNSDTVQPPSLVGMFLIVAFGVAHNIGEADVANVMQAVEQVQTSVGTLEQGVGNAIDYIVESYRNGTEWYRKWKSGWVEQGGVISATGSHNGTTTISLLIPYASDDYAISGKPCGFGISQTNNTDNMSINHVLSHTGSIYEKTATSFKINNRFKTGWYACGQGA